MKGGAAAAVAWYTTRRNFWNACGNTWDAYHELQMHLEFAAKCDHPEAQLLVKVCKGHPVDTWRTRFANYPDSGFAMYTNWILNRERGGEGLLRAIALRYPPAMVMEFNIPTVRYNEKLLELSATGDPTAMMFVGSRLYDTNILLRAAQLGETRALVDYNTACFRTRQFKKLIRMDSWLFEKFMWENLVNINLQDDEAWLAIGMLAQQFGFYFIKSRDRFVQFDDAHMAALDYDAHASRLEARCIAWICVARRIAAATCNADVRRIVARMIWQEGRLEPDGAVLTRNRVPHGRLTRKKDVAAPKSSCGCSSIIKFILNFYYYVIWLIIIQDLVGVFKFIQTSI